MKILLVEDDLSTQTVLQAALTKQNFLVDVATDGETAWELIGQFAYDLVLLDVMLPRLDGIGLCRRLRQADNPILVMLITSRDNVTDKILGLESGADDYLTKPINIQELIARIRTLSRRHAVAATPVLTWERLSLDPVSREVAYNGQSLKIGRKEYLIIELLLRHPQQVFDRHEIIDRLWSLDAEIPTDATVKSHIRSIRRKLEEAGASDLIETLYGQGYRLNPALHPVVDSPLSPAALQHIEMVTAQVWQRAYSKSLDKIAQLEQAIAALPTKQVNEELRQQTVFTAHKLSGSLGVFGFEVAAQLAQQIEDTFRTATVSATAVPQLLQWVQALRLELAGQQSSNEQIQTMPPLKTIQVSADWVGTRILVLDDEQYVLNQVESILSREGMQTQGLAKPDRLWQVIDQVQPDLLIVDLLLPDISGLEVCQQIRQHRRWAKLPILVLSARSDRNTINQVFAAGADDYISKPIDAEELLTRLTNRLSRYRLLQGASSTHRLPLS